MTKLPFKSWAPVGAGFAGLLLAAGCALFPAQAKSSKGAAPGPQVALDFEGQLAGQAPRDFEAALTGGGGNVMWAIAEDTSAPRGSKVLLQGSQDQTKNRFPLCIYRPVSARDVDLSVRFKALRGVVDQAAGLVARLKDKDNYYVVRANALEDNVRLYQVVAGVRKQFAGADIPVSAGQWHALRLVVRGTRFQVHFDGRLLFEADDATFPEPGRVGLWTKADSVTEFDDLTIAVTRP